MGLAWGGSDAHLHKVVFQHGLRNTSHRVVGLQQVIVDLKLLPAVVPAKAMCGQFKAKKKRRR